MDTIQKLSWKSKEAEKLFSSLSPREIIEGTLAQVSVKRGGGAARHVHDSEECSLIVSGVVKYVFDDAEVVLNSGEVLVIPPKIPHWVVGLQDAVVVLFFSPALERSIQGEIQYLRKPGQPKTEGETPAAALWRGTGGPRSDPGAKLRFGLE
jgi:quercetin dioxygenase-like cupin family protein